MDTLLGMRTFCAVVDEGSFVKGAASINISAALASKYVSQLEEHLGVTLLNRTTRSMALTEAGQIYYQSAAQMIDELDALELVIKDCQTDPVGHLRISAPVNFGQDHLSQALAAFLREHSGITIETRLTDRFVDIVDEGFDLAIRIGMLNDSSLIARKLMNIPVCLFASPAYIARHGAPERPEDLVHHQCIVDHNYRGKHNWAFQTEEGRKTVAVSGRYASDSLSSCRKMALEGIGIAQALEFAVQQDLAEGRLVRLLGHVPQPQVNLYALYPKSRHVPSKVRACIDYLSVYFNKDADRLRANHAADSSVATSAVMP